MQRSKWDVIIKLEVESAHEHGNNKRVNPGRANLGHALHVQLNEVSLVVL